jgi:undecaprenyl-diphosphatase
MTATGSLRPSPADRLADRWPGRTRAGAVAGIAALAWAVLTPVTAFGGMVWVGPLAGTGAVRLDRELSRTIAGMRTPTADALARVGSLLGDTLTIVVAFSVLVVVLAALERWPLMALFATALPVELLVFLTAMLATRRERPDVVALGAVAGTGSFPSGHTAAAVCLYGGVALVARWCSPSPGLRTVSTVVAVAAAVAVGLARLYDGQHHLYDVVWGWLLGLACLFAGAVAARVVGQRAGPPVRAGGGV